MIVDIYDYIATMATYWLYDCSEIREDRIKATDIIKKGNKSELLVFMKKLLDFHSKGLYVRACYLELNVDVCLRALKILNNKRYELILKDRILEFLNEECEYAYSIGKKYQYFLDGPKSLLRTTLDFIINNIDFYEDKIHRLPMDIIDEHFNEFKIWMYKNINS